MNDIPILNQFPEHWRGWILVAVWAAPYVTRGCQAIMNGRGIKGFFSAMWLGTNTPKDKP